MSIATAIQNAQQKVANAYTAVNAKGGTLPATQDLSNLPTAINSISGGGMDTVEAYNNTGSAISTGDKVWINQDDAGYKINDYTVWSTNVTPQGSPIIENGVASDFGSSNYLYTDKYFNVAASDSWEIGVCFNVKRTPSTVSGTYISCFDRYTNGPYITIESNGYMAATIAANGSWIGGWNTGYAPTLNKKYWIKLTHNGSGLYTAYISEDGETFTSFGSGSLTTFSLNKIMQLGYGNSGTYLPGNIYLADCYIKVNGVETWRGYVKTDKINAPNTVLTGTAAENIAVSGTGDVEVGTVITPPTKKYNLLDRVKDDSNNEIGTVSGFFTDANNVEYAVVCLDAQYRLASGKWYSSTSETVTNLPNYNDTTWGPWEAKETATFNTQKILDSCAESGDTSTACSHCRTLSFTVDGTTYYGQLPNMIELYEIVRNHTAINAKDTTASSYSSVDLASIKNIWSSSQFSNNYAWFACSAYGDFSIDDKRYDNMVIPVLEIPNT